MQISFFLHDVLITEVMSFLYSTIPVTACELRQDLKFYITWRKYVPSMFLSTQLLETRFWFHIANPMCRYHPYHPRKFLNMRPAEVWSPTLTALGNMICKEKIRAAKTYKRCALRWIWDCCDNLELWYWFYLRDKLFTRLSSCHFHSKAPLRFVEEALQQIASCTHVFSFSGV